MGSPPSPEQINSEDPGSFSDHDLELFNSAKDKIAQTPAYTSGGRYPVEVAASTRERQAHLTADESAAWHKYKDDLSKHWKSTQPDAPAPQWDRYGQNETYHEDQQDIQPSDDVGEAKPPTVPDPVAGGEDGNGSLVVNTDAIATFKSNLGELRKILSDSQSSIENMEKIKPGYFGMGGSMYRAICGDKGAPGLQENTAQFLTSTVTAFDKLMADIDAMIKEYKSVDDLNTLSADKLNKQFQDAFDAMNAIAVAGP